METIKTIAIGSYVAEVSRLAKTGKATEHTFRGALAALIDALTPGLKAVNEPKRTDCGAPDYIVQDKTGLGVFYVEAKDLRRASQRPDAGDIFALRGNGAYSQDKPVSQAALPVCCQQP